MIDYERVGRHLKAHRLQMNQTQQEMADRCGITKSFLSKIENGKALPSLGTLSKLAEELNIALSDLMSEETDNRLWQHDAAKEIVTNLYPVDAGYKIFPFANQLMHKKIQPFFMRSERANLCLIKMPTRARNFFMY